jgi:hypothetical protein
MGADFRLKSHRSFCRHDLAPFRLAMSHHHFGRRQGVTRAASLVWGSFFALVIVGPAAAGEFGRSTPAAGVAHPARCDGANGDCRRISGYVAAGGGFQPAAETGAIPTPFGPLDPPKFMGAMRAAGGALIQAPAAALERIFAGPSPADEAR